MGLLYSLLIGAIAGWLAGSLMRGGGFSTFFLNNNNIFEIQNGNGTLIGEANNINDVSYSANFGLGMFYNFSKSFQFNLEPMFKYQINTFSNTFGDFQPFFVGVYTGLSFKF